MIHRISTAGEWPKTAKCGVRITADPNAVSKVHVVNDLAYRDKDVRALFERISIKPCGHCWPRGGGDND